MEAFSETAHSVYLKGLKKEDNYSAEERFFLGQKLLNPMNWPFNLDKPLKFPL
jgi:hypothetical protein